MDRIATIPRVRFGNLPTPFYELHNLSKALKGPRIFIKRDDLIGGLALGGNKVRKLEFVAAEAVMEKSDYLVSVASFQSNWLAQVAAAASRLGMKSVIIKRGPEDGYDPEDYEGNHLIHFLQGAKIKVVEYKNLEKTVEGTMEELRAAGRRPFLIKIGGSTPPGITGYVLAMFEIVQQAIELGVGVDYVVHATGSGGTQAGLVIGAKALSTNIKVIGSTTGARTKAEEMEKIPPMIDEALGFMHLNLKITEEDIVVYDQYAGGGYGFMSEAKAEAVKLMAETEGIIIDTVYAGSATACMIDLCRQGFFKRDDVVVLIHTGGIGGLFPYQEPLKAYGLGKPLPWKVPPWWCSFKV